MKVKDRLVRMIGCCCDESLTEELESIRDSLQVAAPEMEQFWLRRVANELVNHLPADPINWEPWQQDVVDWWLDKKT